MTPTDDFLNALDDLAWAIADDGFEPNEHRVARLLGGVPVHPALTRLVSAVGDRQLAPVVRARAFGRLRLALDPRTGPRGLPFGYWGPAEPASRAA